MISEMLMEASILNFLWRKSSTWRNYKNNVKKMLDISLNKLFFFLKKERCKGIRGTRTKRKDEKKNQWGKNG